MWPYKVVYETLKDYMENIYSHLITNEKKAPNLPDLRIRPMARTIFSKYYPKSDNNMDGIISINSRYLPENPANNELIYFVMLIAHDLCQCVAMRKNEAAKPHGKEVKALLKQIGIVYNRKAPLSFTKDEDGKLDGLLYLIIHEAGLEQDIERIKPPEVAPAIKKPKQHPLLDQIDQPTTVDIVMSIWKILLVQAMMEKDIFIIVTQDGKENQIVHCPPIYILTD